MVREYRTEIEGGGAGEKPASRHYGDRDKTYAKFYASKEWRELRNAFVAFKRHRCEKCGDHRPWPRGIEVHHIKELRDGGAALGIENLQALCPACHRGLTASAQVERRADEVRAALLWKAERALAGHTPRGVPLKVGPLEAAPQCPSRANFTPADFSGPSDILKAPNNDR